MDSSKFVNKQELLEELVIMKPLDMLCFGNTILELQKQYNLKTPDKIKVKYLLHDGNVPPVPIWLPLDALFKMISNQSYKVVKPVSDPKYQAWMKGE